MSVAPGYLLKGRTFVFELESLKKHGNVCGPSCMSVCACAVSGCHSDVLYKFVVTFKRIRMITVYAALCNGDPDRISVRTPSSIF